MFRDVSSESVSALRAFGAYKISLSGVKPRGEGEQLRTSSLRGGQPSASPGQMLRDLSGRCLRRPGASRT